MDAIALSMPDIQTAMTIVAALGLGGFTLALALSCKAHDSAED